jgi:hypothetical protein
MDDLQIMQETGLSREDLNLLRKGYGSAPAATPYYRERIAETIGCSKPEVVNAVEDLMRQETGGCLDSIDRNKFNRLARESFALYEYIMGKQIVICQE